jgi:hypothetical protein
MCVELKQHVGLVALLALAITNIAMVLALFGDSLPVIAVSSCVTTAVIVFSVCHSVTRDPVCQRARLVSFVLWLLFNVAVTIAAFATAELTDVQLSLTIVNWCCFLFAICAMLSYKVISALNE